MALPILAKLFAIALAITLFILVLVFVMVPLFKGIGWLIGALFKGIGWLVAHLFEFVVGMIGDSLRFVGAILATVVLIPLSLLNVVIGRWSAAGHFAESVKREWKVGALCVYRVCLRRPLKLLLLHGLLEGVEERVPEAMAAAPTRDKPSRRTGQFSGYTIVGSLKGGGSGAKLYIAEPDATVRAKYPGMPHRVVIKSFALTEGSSLPQIVRESRALECAKQMGLVLDHGMNEQRFHYVMPYHAGEHLGIVTRQLHGETGGRGLEKRQLEKGLGYTCDLVETLSHYHSGGLWHKDVKPENVIIHDGRAHLVDLGLVTPLRSAMTLTTHGTEYFRDPEMVRQALRGVKVHQVNGAKFDIFAAAAVLYFVMENDFPAHGALSRFTRRSPEAIKWIVRRGMADYNHRYETAEAMLSDLRHVAASGDPFTVKPAELPSMRGREGEEAGFEMEQPEVERVVRAGSPAPPAAGAVEGSRAGAGPMPTPQAPAEGNRAGAGAMPTPQAPAVRGRRPKLQVVNWWTGEYRVADAGSAGGSGGIVAGVGAGRGEVMREQVTAFRHQAAQIRHQAKRGAVSTHRAAREQLKAARRRAREMRTRAREHRHRALAERQPSLTLFGIVVVTLILLAGSIATVSWLRGGSGGIFGDGGSMRVSVPQLPAVLGATSSAGDGRPIILVRDLSDPEDGRHAKPLAQIARKWERDGYEVILAGAEVEQRIGKLLLDWRESDGAEAADRALEDALERYGFYAALGVSEEGGSGSGNYEDNLVHAERAGAGSRRYLIGPAPDTGRPYVFINDCAVTGDPEFDRWMEALRTQLEVRQWNIIDADDQIEAAVRGAMPPGILDSEVPMPKRFHVVLEEHGLGGMIYLHSSGWDGSDDGPRTLLRRIDAEPIAREEGGSEEGDASEGKGEAVIITPPE